MATKQLNKRLVVMLTLIGFAGIVLLSVLMLRQLQRRDPKYFVDLAESSAKQQQWPQATLFYNEAWERSNDAKYIVDAGEMLLRDGEVGRALGAWRQALVQQPDLVEGHVRQLKLLMQLSRLYGTPQRWQEVHEAAENLLKVETNRTDEHTAFAHNALGQALLNLENQAPQNADRGLAELVEATQLAPKAVEYSTALAALLTRRDKADEAEALLKAQVERYPSPGAEGAQARLAYARFLSERQRFDEASNVFHDALKTGEADAEVLHDAKMGYAAFLTQRWVRAVIAGTKEAAQPLLIEAEGVLKETLTSKPDAFEPYLQMAILYKTAQRHEDVVHICEQRIRKGMSRKGVEATQNRIAMFTLMIYASESCVALGIKAGEADDKAARESWLAKADQYVADAKGESATHPRILSQAGRVKLARGLDREALADLRAADDAYGGYETVNWENKLILAQVHLRLNEAGAAKAVMEGVLEQASKYRSRDPIFWNLYAQSLLMNNELDRALAVCDRVLMLDPNNSDARQLRAAVFERQGKHAEAGREHEIATGSPTVRALLEARAKAIAGDVDGAVRILREALEKDPGDSRLVGSTVNELVGLDRYEDAQAVIQRAMQVKPEDARLRKLSALTQRDLSAEQRDAAMWDLIQLEEDAFQRSLDAVMYHSRRQDFTAALASIDEAEKHLLAKDTPLSRTATSSQHAVLLKTKIRAAVEAKDEAAMAAAKDAAAKYNVDGAGGKALLGWYHMQRKEVELALNAFREAVAAQPTDAPSRANMGQCLQLLGRVEEAQTAYEAAVKANPSEPFAHQGLALLAQKRGDTETFQRELVMCEKLLPSDAWVQEQVLIRTEEADPQAAIQRREGKLAESPEDARNLQRLAVLYETASEKVKAEKAYETLLKLKPDDERTLLAASSFLRRTDRAQAALDATTRYAAARPTTEARANAQMFVANEYIQQKRLPEAEQALLEGLKSAETQELFQALAEFYIRAKNEPVKALPWYQKAIDRARQANAANLPELLEAKVGSLLNRLVNDVEGAKKDVDELRQSFPDYARGWLWVSEIAARTGNIDGAVDALTSYLDKRPDDAYALYQRARHHVSRGRISAAVADLEACKRVAPTALELQPRLYLANVHLRAGRKDLWIQELESAVKDAPTSPAAIEELAKGYLQEKRHNDADRVLTAEINRVGAKSDARWHFLRGQVSLDLNQVEKAVSEYRRGAEVGGFAPNAVLQVLTLYVRAGRFPDGVDYFRQHGGGERATSAVTAKYGQLLAKSGQKGPAVEAFRQAMKLALAESADAVQVVARDGLEVFEAKDGLAAFAASPTDSANAKANERLLIRFHTEAKNFDEAVQRVNALIRAAADDTEAAVLLQERGDIQQTANQFDPAIASYRMAIEKDSTNWVTLNNVAYLLSDAKGENKEALTFAKQAVGRSENEAALDTLGWIYAGLGQYAEAVAELSRAIRLKPDYALSYYHLGEAYRRSSQFAEATSILTDGQALAESGKDTALVALITASRAKIEQRDAKP